MKKSCVFLLLFITTYACTGKGKGVKQEEKTAAIEKRDIVAIVGSEPISLEEFDAEFRSIRKEYPEKLTPALSLTLTKIKKEFLENLISEKFLAQIAKASGISLSSSEVKSAVMRATGHSIKDTREMVEAQGIAFSVWLRKVKEKVVAEKLIRQEVYEKIFVSLDDIKRYFLSNPSLFVRKEKVHLLQIVMETEAEALEALRKIRRGKSFKKIASSTFDWDKQNADLGYLERGKLPKNLEKAGFALKKGKVSDVIATKHGFHILKCINKSERQQMSFKEASPIAKARLVERKMGKAYKEWITNKRKNIKIVVNPDLLKIKENIVYREKSDRVRL